MTSYDVLREEIVALERRLYDAQLGGVSAHIAPMLSADLRYVHSTGVDANSRVPLRFKVPAAEGADAGGCG